jgi:hypothetical protein
VKRPKDDDGSVPLATLGPATARGRRNARTPFHRFRARYALVRAAVGAVALVGLAFSLIAAVHSINNGNALNASPLCAAGARQADCRTRVSVTVTGTQIKRQPREGREGEIDTREYGAIRLLSEVTTGDIWHGRLVALTTADGESLPTLDAPANDTLGWTLLVVVCEVAAFFPIRSVARRRLRRRLGNPGPWTASENIVLAAAGLAMSLVLVAGTILLFVGSAWAGTIVVGIGMATVLYSVTVPQISWRTLNSVVGIFQSISRPTPHGPVPKARVATPAGDASPDEPAPARAG